MNIAETSLPGVLLLTPNIYRDDRGAFWETWNYNRIAEAGLPSNWVQDNFSISKKNVIRGIHYQLMHPQGKLVRVVAGEIFDVAVDLRKSSPTFGRWHGVHLSGENKQMLWIPPGLAHGFSVISDGAHVIYKATDFYHPELERTLLWNDSDLNIDWELKGLPILSAKDKQGLSFQSAEKFD